MEEERTARRRRRRRIIRKTVKWTLLSIVMLIAAICIFLFVRFYPTYREYTAKANEVLLDMDGDTFRRTGNTYIYDADGELIGEIGNERYEYVAIEDVSDYVTYGYVAKEDRDFFSHSGVDWKSTARAALALVRNRGEITQGGSTITQQVVKNSLLSQEQTFERKIMEILLALRLERQYSKSQILEFYVNSCYYGKNCYGIEGASEYYFGTSSKELTPGEAAMLVATSNSPSAHNPEADYDGMLTKMQSVLDVMLEEGYITQAEHDGAYAETPDVVLASDNVGSDSYMTTYALHSLALGLMKSDGFAFRYTFSTGEEYETYVAEYSEAYSEALDEARGGGYRIYTSFEPDVQEALQDALDSGLSGFTDRDEDGKYEMQGAAVCIDNSTGLVIAAVGGREGEGSFNRAYQAKRQPGSAIKPLLDYAPALDLGVLYPDTVYTDAKFDDNGYSPSNSGGTYYGNVQVREAVARSLNTVALQVFLDVGRDSALSYLDALHFSSLTYADSTADSIAIGGFTDGVTVSDMAKGYYALENGGTYTDASCLVYVEAENGTAVYNYETDAEETQAYNADAAYIMTDMMQGAFRVDGGTARKAYDKSQIYAGKTGTTNDNKDAWFCGYSAYYTTAVWAGCDTPKAVSGLTGSSYPLSIWSSFMSEMHDGLDKKDFTVPADVYLGNSEGGTKEVKADGDSYAARPGGYDYRSERIDRIAEAREAEREDKEASEEALKLLEEFETFQIASYEDAVSFEERYNTLLAAIDKINDASIRSEYMARAAKKYGLLSGEVTEHWADAQEKLDEAAQEQLDADNRKAAEQSLLDADSTAEQAAKQAEEARKDLIEWYISRLGQCQYYTSAVKQMIADAKEDLAGCTAFSWYGDVQKRLSEAISRAEGLPEEPEAEDITPDISKYSDGLNEWEE